VDVRGGERAGARATVVRELAAGHATRGSLLQLGLARRLGQGQVRQDRASQDRTGQDRTGQDRTGQDRSGQVRSGQDRTVASRSQAGRVSEAARWAHKAPVVQRGMRAVELSLGGLAAAAVGLHAPWETRWRDDCAGVDGLWC
jgi:hypothetical protein